MPCYDYICPSCGVFDGYAPMAQSSAPGRCPKCGQLGNKVFLHPPRVFGDTMDFPEYESPATGKWIAGRRQAREDLLRSGCHLYEPGEKEDNARRLAAKAVEVDRQVDEAVERAVGELRSN